MSNVVLDTNVLLGDENAIDCYEHIILCSSVLEELDGLKKDSNVGFFAREAIRKIEKNLDKIHFETKDIYNDVPDGWDGEKRDNKIILCAKEHRAKLISNDINVIIKANSINIPVEKHISQVCKIDYKGFKVVEMSEDEMAKWYQNHNKSNDWDLCVNEYLLIKDNSKIVDCWVWTNNGFRHLSTKKIDSIAFGKLKVLDEFQSCAIDSFFNNPMTMIKGKAGTGKSLLTMAYCLSMIEKGKIDKLIVFTNPMATKNSAKLGFYPGSKDEKLLDSQVGHMLTSKLGDRLEVEKMIKNGSLVLLPFSDIRGFDTTGMRALIWITESQNLDVELMRLAIQRIGDDCQLIIDGDYDAQVDCDAFNNSNNGMRRVSEVFKGQDFYGEIELQNVYRSKWADWANKL